MADDRPPPSHELLNCNEFANVRLNFSCYFDLFLVSLFACIGWVGRQGYGLALRCNGGKTF